MKSLKILVTAFAVLAAPVAASQAPASGAPVMLHRGNGAEPDTLDPHKATGQWENNIIGDMMMGLTTDDVRGEPIPGMAESWETSEDGLVWTFKLRPEAVWSDGEPVTAHDFVFALQRINNPATSSQYASITHIIKNAREVSMLELPPEQIGARAIDDHTLELTLAHAAPYLPSLLTHYTFFPVPRHAVEKHGDAWVRPGNYISNGAFTLTAWNPNSFVEVRKNPRFYDAANVAIDAVRYYSQEDQIANAKRFRAGELDLSAGIPGQLLDELRRSIPEKVRTAQAIINWYIVFNLTRDTWKDERIRTALGMAIDREVIVQQILRGGETPAYTFIPPGIPGYPYTAKLSYADMTMAERIARAKELLAEVGYGPGNPLRFELLHMQSTDGKRIATALQSMWKTIGVEMTPAGSETKVVYANLRQQNFDISIAGWIADFPDASSHLYLAKTASEEMNYAKYSNAAFDQLNIDADNEPDAAKRSELLARAEQILLDDAPMVPIYNAVSRNLVQPYVRGFEDALTNVHRTRWMSIDRGGQAADASEAAASPGQASPQDGGAAATPAPAQGAGGESMAVWWLLGGLAVLGGLAIVLLRRRRPGQPG